MLLIWEGMSLLRALNDFAERVPFRAWGQSDSGEGAYLASFAPIGDGIVLPLALDAQRGGDLLPDLFICRIFGDHILFGCEMLGVSGDIAVLGHDGGVQVNHVSNESFDC